MFTHRSWKWISVALLATGPLLFTGSPAAADGSSPLGRYLYQNGYVAMHVDNNGHNQAVVRVGIDGVGITMVLDTGCGRTCITNRLAHDLKLDVQPESDPMVGVGGQVSGSGVAVLHSFSLNSSPVNRTDTVRVLPPRASVTQDGILGYDYMRLNSVILPVGVNYFLYRAGFQPPVEIDSFLKASGFQPIPLTYGEGGLRAAGSLDGHPLVAVVDCGANFTMFDSDFVQTTIGAFVTKSRLVSWGVDGRPMYVGIFNADKLTFGALTFPPTRTTTASGTTLHAIHAQALLGYDLLAQHHAIIDIGHGVLWMK
jgi:hypothetical protein